MPVASGGKIILKDWLTCSEVVDVDKTYDADRVTWKLLAPDVARGQKGGTNEAVQRSVAFVRSLLGESMRLVEAADLRVAFLFHLRQLKFNSRVPDVEQRTASLK